MPGAGTGPNLSEARLDGALRLLNVLIGIRLRGVDDPESRRHLTWLNDIVAALGLWSRRTVAGRFADFTDYLEAAVGFWSRSGGRRIAFEPPAAPVSIDDMTAAALSIIAHELLGAAVGEDGPEGAPVVLSVEAGPVALRLAVSSAGGQAPLLDGEALELVQGLADHFGGRVELGPEPGASAAVVLPTRAPASPRH